MMQMARMHGTLHASGDVKTCYCFTVSMNERLFLG
jgi:hypothetical protein